MATIDDIRAVERLMQTLDENPHLMEAVRSRILTRELLALPQTMARLTEQVEQLTERMDRLTERVEQLTERMDRRLGRIENDIGEFRDAAAIDPALKNAAAIAASLGLIRTRDLSQDELIAMVRDHDTTDIARNDLQSFYLADLIVQAVDDQDETHYVAVEASFTADARYTRRAIRNAGYLTRFTGRPAQAMIVARRTDWEIDEQVASGAVRLFRLPERRSRDA